MEPSSSQNCCWDLSISSLIPSFRGPRGPPGARPNVALGRRQAAQGGTSGFRGALASPMQSTLRFLLAKLVSALQATFIGMLRSPVPSSSLICWELAPLQYNRPFQRWMGHISPTENSNLETKTTKYLCRRDTLYLILR